MKNFQGCLLYSKNSFRSRQALDRCAYSSVGSKNLRKGVILNNLKSIICLFTSVLSFNAFGDGATSIQIRKIGFDNNLRISEADLLFNRLANENINPELLTAVDQALIKGLVDFKIYNQNAAHLYIEELTIQDKLDLLKTIKEQRIRANSAAVVIVSDE